MISTKTILAFTFAAVALGAANLSTAAFARGGMGGGMGGSHMGTQTGGLVGSPNGGSIGSSFGHRMDRDGWHGDRDGRHVDRDGRHGDRDGRHLNRNKTGTVKTFKIPASALTALLQKLKTEGFKFRVVERTVNGKRIAIVTVIQPTLVKGNPSVVHYDIKAL